MESMRESKSEHSTTSPNVNIPQLHLNGLTPHPCCGWQCNQCVHIIFKVSSSIWGGNRQLLTEVCPDENSKPKWGGNFAWQVYTFDCHLNRLTLLPHCGWWFNQSVNIMADVCSSIWDGNRQLLTEMCPDENSKPNWCHAQEKGNGWAGLSVWWFGEVPFVLMACGQGIIWYKSS